MGGIIGNFSFDPREPLAAAAIVGLELRHPPLDRDLVPLAALVPAPIEYAGKAA